MSDCLVKPCPFCGSRNIKSGGDDKVVGYWCLDCEATGPNQYGRYEWNDRADRIEELEAEIARLRQLVPRPDQTRDELVWRDHMRGVPLEALAKEFGVTRERMRHTLKRTAERRLHLKGETDE